MRLDYYTVFLPTMQSFALLFPTIIKAYVLQREKCVSYCASGVKLCEVVQEAIDEVNGDV